MSLPAQHTQGGLADVFADKNSDFDLDIVDSLSYSNEQLCKTGWQDSLEIKYSFQTLSEAKDTVVTPQISFHRLSQTVER